MAGKDQATEQGLMDIGRMDFYDTVEKEFFEGTVVSIDENLEGQRSDGSGLVLGCKAGPFKCLTNLLHEMGHLVELEQDRLLELPDGGWGLRHGRRFTVGGRTYHEMTTDAAVLREARVWAYQVSLQRHYGIYEPVTKTVSSAIYIDSWPIFRNKHVPNEGQSEEQRDHLGLKTLADMVDRMSRADFNIRAFRASWRERVVLLEEEHRLRTS